MMPKERRFRSLVVYPSNHGGTFMSFLHNLPQIRLGANEVERLSLAYFDVHWMSENMKKTLQLRP